MIKDKKFLFVFRAKIDQLIQLYERDSMQINSPRYINEFEKVKDIQSGWMDVVENKILICSFSYPIDWINKILSYRYWLKFAKFARKTRVEKWFDILFLNMHIILLALGKKFDTLMYYDRDILSITEKILCKLNITIIEYDGRAPSVSKRNFTKDVVCKNKHLVSCMDFTHLVNKYKENVHTLILGLNKKLSIEEHEINFLDRDIDIVFFGSLDPNIWKKRVEIIEELLESLPSHINFQIFGRKQNCENYPNISKKELRFIYSPEEMKEICLRTKMTILIPSDDHISLASGMPSKIFENTAYGIPQLIYCSGAMNNMKFINGEHYIGFSSNDEILEKINVLLSDDNKILEISNSALNLYNKEYTAQTQMKRLINEIFKK